MPPLAANVRRAAERSTLTLPFAIPAKDWFSLREVAALSGMSESYVEKKFDEGRELSGHVHNGGRGARDTKRVPHVWFVAWMIQTAHYDDESLGDALLLCLRRLPRETLLRISATALRLAGEAPAGISACPRQSGKY